MITADLLFGISLFCFFIACVWAAAHWIESERQLRLQRKRIAEWERKRNLTLYKKRY